MSIAEPKLVAPLSKVLISKFAPMGFKVVVKAATPSCRQASDLSTLGRLPNPDHVVPPFVLIQYGVDTPPTMDVLLKAAEIMLFELSGSTAMLGSEFWPVSACIIQF